MAEEGKNQCSTGRKKHVDNQTKTSRDISFRSVSMSFFFVMSKLIYTGNSKKWEGGNDIHACISSSFNLQETVIYYCLEMHFKEDFSLS